MLLVFEPLIVIALGIAVEPAEAEVLAVDPGVIVTVQDDPGAKVTPQVDTLVVPDGSAGLVEMLNDDAEFCPVFVTINILCVPLVAKAKVVVLKDRDVMPGGLSVQLIKTVVTFTLTLFPK